MSVQRNLERARTDLRSSLVAAAGAMLSVLGHAIGIVARLLRALRALRRALHGGRFSRDDLKDILLILTGLGLMITAATSMGQAVRAHDHIEELGRDLNDAGRAADDLRQRLQSFATRIDRECTTDRYVG